jgi:hypothetical protein
MPTAETTEKLSTAEVSDATYIRFTAPHRARGRVPTLSLHLPGESPRSIALTEKPPWEAFHELCTERTEKAPWSFPLRRDTIERRTEQFVERYRYWLLDNHEEVARPALRLAW